MLTHPPGLLHVTTRQPLHKVNACQWRARWGQQDGGIHHEIFHIHGLHLEETSREVSRMVRHLVKGSRKPHRPPPALHRAKEHCHPGLRLRPCVKAARHVSTRLFIFPKLLLNPVATESRSAGGLSPTGHIKHFPPEASLLSRSPSSEQGWHSISPPRPPCWLADLCSAPFTLHSLLRELFQPAMGEARLQSPLYL